MKIALSLFDGMSCGQLALQRAGVSVDYYLASEVDQYAMTVTKKNFPETEHIGDVREVDGTSMISPFILMGGSPCQSFSFAGTRIGMATEQGEEITTLERYLELKGEGFQFSGQSYLFWEYVRILRETKPKYFLLENVKMAKKWENIISETLGVCPIVINSALVSAQNRERLYWTNIPVTLDIKDKELTLKDVIKDMAHRKITIKHPETIRRTKNYAQYDQSLKGHGSQDQRFFYLSGKSGCITMSHSSVPKVETAEGIIVLNPEEVEALQTVPEGYTSMVERKHRYKMLGNGWTVDVIAHILRHIPEEEK